VAGCPTCLENFEIGRVLHLKSEIRNLKLNRATQTPAVQFEISDFGFEMQDSSNFKIPFPLPGGVTLSCRWELRKARLQ
jgi:hypothetical protein